MSQGRFFFSSLRIFSNAKKGPIDAVFRVHEPSCEVRLGLFKLLNVVAYQYRKLRKRIIDFR